MTPSLEEGKARYIQYSTAALTEQRGSAVLRYSPQRQSGAPLMATVRRAICRGSAPTSRRRRAQVIGPAVRSPFLVEATNSGERQEAGTSSKWEVGDSGGWVVRGGRQ